LGVEMRLYIIGNGFDRNHGFETGYWNYREFLKKNYNNVLSDFESFQYVCLHTNDKWTDLEDALTIDYESLMHDAVNNGYPDLSNDSDSRWNDLEVDLDTQLRFIHGFTGKFFYEWFINTDFSSPSHILSFLNVSDLYVTFNYTSTLENIYKIPDGNILHIHGHIKQISSSDIQMPVIPNFLTIEDAETTAHIRDDLINADIVRNKLQFGSIKNDAKRVEEALKTQYEDDEFYGASLEPGINNIIDFCKAASKNLKENYQILSDFINNGEIDEVVVMGHSILGVDYPYYSDIILPKLAHCSWRFYCNSDEDVSDARKFAKEFSLKNFHIERW